MEHLNSRWCPLNVHAKKNLCIAYYAEWDGKQHLTASGKRLDDDQVRIKCFGITISDKDKLQFCLEQMYALNHFDKKEMTEWKNKPEAIKNDFNNAKTYFEGLVRDYEVYEQNSGGTTGKHNFKSVNQAAEADHGNELHQYIARIAQAAVKQEEQAANIRDSTKASTDAMAAQIKAMSDQIAQLTKAMANKRMHQMAAAAKVAAAAVAAEEGTKDKPDRLECNTPSHAAWAATVLCTDSIQPARTTQAPPARGNYPTTTRRQLGTTEKVVASTGQHPYASALSSRTMQHKQARQHQPTDRDRGSLIANKKRTIAKQ